MGKLETKMKELKQPTEFADIEKFNHYVDFSYGTKKRAMIHAYFDENMSFEAIADYFRVTVERANRVVCAAIQGFCYHQQRMLNAAK